MLELELSSLENIGQTDHLSASLLTEEMGAYEYTNSSKGNKQIVFAHDKKLIHFIFSLAGNVSVWADGDNTKQEVATDNFFVFSNPYQSTKLFFDVKSASKVFTIIISIKELHEIFGSSFGKDAQAMNEFMESYKMKKFFINKVMTPSISILAHQFFSGVKRPNLQKIFHQGKIMEFLSLYMDAPNSEQEADDACPFVMDALELSKIKEARDIIVGNMISPPSLKSLAKLVGTNEFKLKFGFKSVYSNTVYGYLLDYRLEHARKRLSVDKSRINEVATEVGYSNSSHFIAAYKRKYGITPKQHLLSVVS